MAQHVVQFLGDPQPFLTAPAAFDLFPGSPDLGQAFAAGPPPLRCGDHRYQPSQPTGHAGQWKRLAGMRRDVHDHHRTESHTGDGVRREPVTGRDGSAER